MKNSALPFLTLLKNNSGQKIRPITNGLSGQSIVEIVLSIGVAALVVGALIVLGSMSLRTGLSSARRAEATRLAISGLEAMRFRRDNNGFDAVSTGCYTIDPTSGAVTRLTPDATEGDCPNDGNGWVQIDLTNSSSQSIFDRKIKVEEYGSTSNGENARMRLVTTTVRWPEGTESDGTDAERSVVMSLVLSNWE